jgi:hypothetical protein
MAVRKLMLLLPAAFAAVATGCARQTHFLRKVDVADAANPVSVSIDAKQRLVLSTKRNVGGTTQAIVCAEPSPDALSALSASGGLSLSNSDREYATNLALAEAAGSIGLRTQSIQLLRDASYRLCEGYLSGALNGVTYQAMQQQYQQSMVAILAIEQLTGAVRAPALQLGGSAAAGSSQRLAELTELMKKTEADIAAGEAEVAKETREVGTAKEAADKANEAGKKVALEEVTKQEGELARASNNVTRLKEQLVTLERQRKAALTGDANVTSVALVSESGGRSDPTSVSQVANVVKDIVLATIGADTRKAYCLSALTYTSAERRAAGINETVTSECLAFLSPQTRERVAAAREEISQKEEVLQNDKAPPVEKEQARDTIISRQRDILQAF